MTFGVQNFIKQELTSILGSLNSLFPNDKLAYYSLQGKNELQIRDEVAYELQCRLDINYCKGNFLVRREWSSSYDKHKRFDLAILEIDNTTKASELVALLEFKAQSFVNKEDWPYGAFYLDVKKMWDFIKNIYKLGEVDMYFIFLHSTQNQNHKTGGYSEAVAYSGILNNKNTTLYNSSSPFSTYNAMSLFWRGFYNNTTIRNALFTKTGVLKQHFNTTKIQVSSTPAIYYNVTHTIPTPNIQNVGNSFGYEWFIAPMIWGPFKNNDITIK